MLQLQSALGIFALLLIALGLSENRRAASLRHAAIGLLATFVTAIVLLKVPVVARAFGAINEAVGAISAASRAGSSFVFGYVGGGPLPFDLKAPGADFVLAFQALPIVLVMSVLTTLLFYWRVLPPIVRGMAWLLERTLGVGGAVGLSTAANIFLGMVEAPLFVRPYLAQMTRSELFLVMTGGMAGIAGTVLVLYATLLAPLIPDAAAHFVIASVLGAPAAILVSLIMVPETSDKRTGGALEDPDTEVSGTMDAIVKGTGAGIELLINIVAMLLVLVALVHLVNAVLGLLPDIGGAAISLQRVVALRAAPARPRDGAGVLADGIAVGPGDHRRQPDGHENRAQRADRLCRFLEAAARHARSALAPDHALCDVRLRQFRQPRHHDRRSRRDGAGTARGNQRARAEVDRVGDADDVLDGSGGGGADVVTIS
ncbi:CNT family concentrative nucleoside transporter [Bradyrhizobium sp. F1.13.4]